MKKIVKQCLLLICFCTMGSGYALHPQSLYQISQSKDNSMKLSGTSTLHNWVMNTGIFNGDAQFDFGQGNDSEITSIKSLTFSIVVLNLKSDKKGLDKNAYKALKATKYKEIFYKLLSATVSSGTDGKYRVKTEGNLSIAGVTKEVTMDVYCLINKDKSISCSGSYKLKMTDYQVKPPTFMLGVMKTGDVVTLDFKMIYKKQSGA